MGNTARVDLPTGLLGIHLSNSPTAGENHNVSRFLHAIRTHLKMDVAFVSEFVGDRRVFRHVDATSGAPIKVGDSGPLEESYCQRVVDGRLPELIPDTAAVPCAMALPVTAALSIGSYLGVPIRLSDGHTYGAFCCFSSIPDQSLNARDIDMMRAFAELTANEIERDLKATWVCEAKIERVKAVIERDENSIVYQPIIRLADNSIVGFECLSRISTSPLRSPDIWFSEAAEVGLGVQLEMAAIRLALSGLAVLPNAVYLTVNLSPATVLSGELARALAGLPAERIVVEITEHAVVPDYGDLVRAVGSLRRAGVRLAVDDAGAGYASLRHILNLKPEFIKLDMSLTRDVDKDPAKRALALALIGFARETDSRIVAEGVETAAELSTMKILGAENAQGYFLGRPAPLAKAFQLLAGKAA